MVDSLQDFSSPISRKKKRYRSADLRVDRLLLRTRSVGWSVVALGAATLIYAMQQAHWRKKWLPLYKSLK